MLAISDEMRLRTMVLAVLKDPNSKQKRCSWGNWTNPTAAKCFLGHVVYCYQQVYGEAAPKKLELVIQALGIRSLLPYVDLNDRGVSLSRLAEMLEQEQETQCSTAP